ncbi:MAG: substrate-binding domain-containing protein [Coriobacteriales bacterium]|jgi:phosphate transport system substrate-binding protein|nr:substrate-binding domain-containing protein [Coriobacteriales bacterium]
MKKKNYLAGGLSIALVAVLSMVIIMIGGCSAQTPSANNSSADSGSGSESSASVAINVVSREDGSGTRSAFVELFGVETEDSSGKTVDATTTSAVVTNSTSVMLTTVSGDPAAIGYISLGSLNNTVKALDIDKVAATTENVKSGSYPIQRPFNIATKGDLSDAAKDFINFIISKEGQAVIEENNYIPIMDVVQAFASNNAEGKVVVAGSSSVSPVMEKLKEAYEALNSAVSIEIQTSDSSTGMSSTIEGICDIGMASRELKDSELSEGLVSQSIALDGIAIIVNNDNAVSALTTEQVRDIYLGTTLTWDEAGA